MTHRFIRRGEVLARLGMRREALRGAIERGDFPPGTKIFAGGRAEGWLEDEVNSYIEARRKEVRKIKSEFPKKKPKGKKQ